MAIFYYTGIIGDYGLEEENDSLTRLWFRRSGQEEEDGKVGDFPKGLEIRETSLLKEAKGQLDAYFAGQLKEFSLPLSPKGTDFQRKIWDLLRQIPYGTTCTYGEVAVMAGNVKASRAVGLANNRNPLPIFIPCHRVVGANGSLTGYAGGLDVKLALLQLEGIWLL